MVIFLNPKLYIYMNFMIENSEEKKFDTKNLIQM